MSTLHVGLGPIAREVLYPVSLVSSILPGKLIEAMRQKPQCIAREAYEREISGLNGRMHAVSLLVANLIIKTVAALRSDHFQALDANPGDMGCQNRALALRRLYKMGLPSSEELQHLEEIAHRIKQSVQNRKGGAKHPDHRPPDVFFQNELQTLRVSKEMEYALHCFLSKTLVQKYEILEDGRSREKSNVSQLSSLSPQIGNTLESSLKTGILENNQTKLSYLSLEAVRREAEEISSLPLEEKELLETMLSPDHTHLYTSNIAYAPKMFGCHFYEVKTLLYRLREEGGVVCFKSIVPKGQEPFLLFFRSPGSGEDFIPIAEEEILASEPVVVFGAVVHLDPNAFADRLMEHGLTEVILGQVAKEAPYEQGSSLEDVQVYEAFEEMRRYKAQGDQVNFLTIDHVYFTVKH